MAFNNFEIEPPSQRSVTRMTQAFPGFKTKTFTLSISVVQFIYYIISVIIDEKLLNPSKCALFILGGNVRSM
jgi:hypothetical protein